MTRIDVHHHVFPPDYLTALNRLGLAETGGGIAFPEWSVEADLEMMDRHGIETAIASISSPGIYFGDAAQARGLARSSNEYLAKLTGDHPKRFGFFASVPLPATDDAILEAGYALDTLKADGILLLGSVADRFLGDPAFAELMQELDRRRAVVFIHPNVHSTSNQLGLKYPPALFEFLADTTRTVLDLVLSGTVHRCPNIRWILSHAGGAIAAHAWRWALADRSPIVQKHAPEGILHYLRKFYFDTALSPSRFALGPVLDLAGAKQILFGSDFPYVHGDVLDFEITQFEELGLFDDATRPAVERINALELFPRFGDSGR